MDNKHYDLSDYPTDQQAVVSAANPLYDGNLQYVTFDGIFIIKAKTKVGVRRSRNQKVRIIRTTHFAH